MFFIMKFLPVFIVRSTCPETMEGFPDRFGGFVPRSQGLNYPALALPIICRLHSPQSLEPTTLEPPGFIGFLDALTMRLCDFWSSDGLGLQVLGAQLRVE